MLLKPTEVEYIELEEEEPEISELEEEISDDSAREAEEATAEPDEKGIIFGKTILIGGSEEPIYLEDDFSSFEDEQADEEDDDYELEFIYTEPIVIGSPREDYYDESELGTDFDSDLDSDIDESLYDLDTDFNIDSSDDLYSDIDMDHDSTISLDDDDPEQWQKKKHSTLIGKVDSQLLDKIKEYRDNIQEMSDEKLSMLSSDENRDRLLMEAAQLVDEVAPSKDINQLISDIDRKLSGFITKHTEETTENLKKEREFVLKEVEQEVEGIIVEQIDLIRQEAEEHIEETVQYYKKKLESGNQVLSNANNIISRREQILDEAYERSLKIVEDAEEEARQIIESSANAQEEADLIIAEAEQQGEEVRQEAEVEAERIISDANVESARIIQAAEDQHQDIVEAATQDGFSVGYQEGKEEAIKENAELLRETMNALNKLHAAFPVAVKQNEEKLIKIAYQISGSVLGEAATQKDELCIRSLNQAIKSVSDFENVKVKVNPADLDIILPKQEYFKAVIPDVREFVINGDDSIPKGGCIINTVSPQFNVNINTQLSILEAVFNDAMAEYEAEEAM